MQTVGEIDDSQSNLSTLLIVRSIEDCNGGGDYVHAETYGICKLGPKTALQSTFIRLDTCARDMWLISCFMLVTFYWTRSLGSTPHPDSAWNCPPSPQHTKGSLEFSSSATPPTTTGRGTWGRRGIEMCTGMDDVFVTVSLALCHGIVKLMWKGFVCKGGHSPSSRPWSGDREEAQRHPW